MHLLAVSDKRRDKKNHNTTHDNVYAKMKTATVNRALRITSCYGMTLRADL